MITVKFSCDGCGLEKHEMQIPARESEHVDIRDYMERVKHWVASEHHRVSPNCQSPVMRELMIPLEGAEFIGQQVE